MERSRNYCDDLLKSLQDPIEAGAYLNAALSEGKEVFFLALKDVVDAHKGMNRLAEDIDCNQEILHKMFSSNPNLAFMEVYYILRGLGYHITITPSDYGSSRASLHQ
jgi:DNA-binding phage protein